MQKTSVRIVPPRRKPKNFEELHMSSEKIARKNIAPFLSGLVKYYKLSKTELAGSLISLAYTFLRSEHDPRKANILFKQMAAKSQGLVDYKKQNNIQ